jgi:putative phosphoribosyl transferase
MNKQALDKMHMLKDNKKENKKKKLVIVPGATHLFEEPGKLEEVASLAAEWFASYLR